MDAGQAERDKLVDGVFRAILRGGGMSERDAQNPARWNQWIRAGRPRIVRRAQSSGRPTARSSPSSTSARAGPDDDPHESEPPPRRLRTSEHLEALARRPFACNRPLLLELAERFRAIEALERRLGKFPSCADGQLSLDLEDDAA